MLNTLEQVSYALLPMKWISNDKGKRGVVTKVLKIDINTKFLSQVQFTRTNSCNMITLH